VISTYDNEFENVARIIDKAM